MFTASRVIKNTGYLYAKMGVTVFISLYTTRLLLIALGGTDFGIFNIIGGSIAMLGFLNAAMASATQRFMSYAEGEGRRDKQKSIFNVSVILHFCIAMLLGIILLIAGYFFFFNGILNIPGDRIYAAKMVYYFMIISTMFTVMTVPYDAVLNAHENMLYYAIVGILESVLKLIVAFIVVYTLLDKLIIYGALMAAISLVVMIVMRVYCHRMYEECVFAPKKYWNKGLMKEMTSSSVVINGYGSGIVLNHFFGTVLNTAYGICGQLNGQMLAFSNNMLKALNPIIVKTASGGLRDKMFSSALTGCKISLMLYAFFAIPFLFEAPYVLTFWLKDVPPYTVVFCRLGCFIVMVEQCYLPLNTTLGAIGKIKQINTYSSLLGYLSIAFLVFLYAVGFPPTAVLVLSMFTRIIMWYVVVYYCWKIGGMHIDIYLKDVVFRCLSVIVLSVVIISLFYWTQPQSLVRLVGVLIFSTLSISSMFYLIGLNSQERAILKNAVVALYKKVY